MLSAGNVPNRELAPSATRRGTLARLDAASSVARVWAARKWIFAVTALMSLGGLAALAGATAGAGKVITWGCVTPPGSPELNYGCRLPPAARSGVTAISSGAWHNQALKKNGSVVAWGCRGKNPREDH